MIMYNDVKHALEIIDKRPALVEMMQRLGMRNMATFYKWLAEEKTYLQSLKEEPEEDSLCIEYYKSLVDWHGTT